MLHMHVYQYSDKVKIEEINNRIVTKVRVQSGANFEVA